MIETWNLTKTFRQSPWFLPQSGRILAQPVNALSDVTLTIDAGEVFGLLGPNGAGKTTFVKLLATLLLPSGGGARVGGADLLLEPLVVRRAVGLVTGDERGFYWRLTGRENLEFFAGLRGKGPRAARGEVAEALELVGLSDVAGQTVARYSSGMRQRLGIARAILAAPPVLFLDEPTRSLDPDAALRIWDLVQRLARESHRTLVLTTHHLDEATALCDRAAILVKGRVREIVRPRDMTTAVLADRYHAVVGSDVGAAAQPAPSLH